MPKLAKLLKSQFHEKIMKDNDSSLLSYNSKNNKLQSNSPFLLKNKKDQERNVLYKAATARNYHKVIVTGL